MSMLIVRTGNYWKRKKEPEDDKNMPEGLHIGGELYEKHLENQEVVDKDERKVE